VCSLKAYDEFHVLGLFINPIVEVAIRYYLKNASRVPMSWLVNNCDWGTILSLQFGFKKVGNLGFGGCFIADNGRLVSGGGRPEDMISIVMDPFYGIADQHMGQ
jgi:hypothetical protein